MSNTLLITQKLDTLLSIIEYEDITKIENFNEMLEKLLTDRMTKEVRYWSTHNSHSNSHMIKINNELKYKELGTFKRFEFDKKSLLAKLLI